MAKMEHITKFDLIRDYLQRNYAGRYVLVVYLEDYDFNRDYEKLMEDLRLSAHEIPVAFRRDGFVFVELDQGTAKQIINMNDKSSIRLELYFGGECIHENR